MSSGGNTELLQKKKRLGPWTSLVIGSVAGGMEAISIWPMEYMKTKLQLQSKYRGGPRLPFTRIMDGIRYTVRTTGFLSLYDGLSVTLLLSIPKAGIRFGGNTYCKSLLAEKDGSLSMGSQFLAGVGAGTIEAVCVVTPMETMKTKMIERHLDMVGGVKEILRSSGVRGMYQGLTATVLKQASNQGMRFMFFNKYKDVMTKKGETQLGSGEAFIGGMLAGTFSTLGNNPMDVVKTKMQGTDARAKYKNTLDCFMQVYKVEGVRGLYRGTAARLARVVPGQGIIFMTVETIESLVLRYIID